ncbi:6-bladed beta-propeller [Motiliproteus sp. SC1-56]|uniref:6-bladed beta-propeller n=1 Tax=Motiliproteus sp. SC1-56 TaxID=2799565 RepID=UPI001A8DBBD7|nr:6-bladed beta-propeller [Motiliproteus sp. SC1-56]
MIRKLVIGSLLFLSIAGCSSQPHVLHFEFPEGTQAVWPPPPEPAKLAYIGDLTGETNFTPEGEDGGLSRSWAKVLFGVGLDPEAKEVLIRPQGVVTDANGRIYVTDVGKQAVFVFDPAAGEVKIWLHTEGTQRFGQPIGILALPSGELLVADAELGRVFRFNAEGVLQGSFGHQLLKRPTGLAFDPLQGRIFVSDTHGHDIKVFDLQGVLVDTWGDFGDQPGQFNSPVYMVYRDNLLYVVDTLNARLQVLDEAGNYLRGFGKRGGFVGNFVRPKGVALDSEGNIYISESYHDYMLIFGQQGRFLLPIGGAGKSAGKFFHPSGIWIDSQNRIYVADMLNGRVSIFQYLGEEV